MGEVRMDASDVAAIAKRVLVEADALDDSIWPAAAPDDLPGSAIRRAVRTATLEDGVAEVVAAMRAWATAASAAAGAMQQADDRHAERLRQSR